MADQTPSRLPSGMRHGDADNAEKDGKKLSPKVVVPPAEEEAAEGGDSDSDFSSESWQDITKEAAEQTGGFHQSLSQEPRLPAVMSPNKSPPHLLQYMGMEYEELYFARDKNKPNPRIAEVCTSGGRFDEDNNPTGVSPSPPSSPSVSPTQMYPPKEPSTPVRNWTSLRGNNARAGVVSSSSGSSPHSAGRRGAVSPKTPVHLSQNSPATSPELPATPTIKRQRSALQPKTNAKVTFFEDLKKK